MNADPVIRPMRLADLDVLMPYEDEMFGAEAWSRNGYLDELRDTTTRWYIAVEQDGAVLGCAGLMVIAETAQILTVAVLPFARGRGLGHQLVRAMVAQARVRRAEEVLLEVRVDNDSARALYAAEGFEVLGTRRGYYEHGRVDAVTMRLALHRAGALA